MGKCYITRRGTKTSGTTEQLGVYPTGEDGRPTGDVTVLNNVTTLSKYPFFENTNVMSIKLPNNLDGFSDYCFKNCTGLQNLDIPDKVTTIPQYCFDGCVQLSEIVLPKDLIAINGYAFNNCSKLSNIIIADNVNNIEIYGYAFRGCKILGNETVTNLATRISKKTHDYAFSSLDGITDITTKYVSNSYFQNCINLQRATILNVDSDGGFGSYVFENCSNLVEVVLPDGATKINNNMFYNNTKLTTVNIPNTIIKIESRAFYNTAIDNIMITNNLVEIGDRAFYGCTNLKTVTVSEKAQYLLSQYAFSNTSVTDESVKNIVSHATSIGDKLFQNCLSLVNVEVPVFANYMFDQCKNLKTAISTKAAESTGDEVFYDCYALTRVVIADGTKNIGSCIFDGCNSLKEVYLPSSITTATNSSLTTTSNSYYAFYNCTALEDVQLGQDWNMSLRLNVSNNITVESMVAMFNSLKDLTGETAKTLTLGSTNLAKLTDEQKAIAINKNWTLA